GKHQKHDGYDHNARRHRLPKRAPSDTADHVGRGSSFAPLASLKQVHARESPRAAFLVSTTSLFSASPDTWDAFFSIFGSTHGTEQADAYGRSRCRTATPAASAADGRPGRQIVPAHISG